MRTLRTIRYLLLALVILAIPATSFAQFGVSITVAPPALFAYSQPICPQEGYLWTPGYWAYGPDGYFWVPGTWVEPPAVGLLWTPGYWGWGNGAYAWNEGYWGPEVGFYGGVNYGYGYGGFGYDGGYWRDNQFSYNTYVNNVGGAISQHVPQDRERQHDETTSAITAGPVESPPGPAPLNNPLLRRDMSGRQPHSRVIYAPPVRIMKCWRLSITGVQQSRQHPSPGSLPARV